MSYRLRIADAEEWICATEPSKRLGIYLLPDQILIGSTSLPTTNGDEAGFWINDRYEGKGYATEAASAVVSYAFSNNGLDFLESGVHRDNLGSTSAVRVLSSPTPSNFTKMILR